MRLKVTTHDKNTLLFRKASMIYVTTRYSLTSYLTFNQKPPVSQLIGPSLQNPPLAAPGTLFEPLRPGGRRHGGVSPTYKTTPFLVRKSCWLSMNFGSNTKYTGCLYWRGGVVPSAILM